MSYPIFSRGEKVCVFSTDETAYIDTIIKIAKDGTIVLSGGQKFDRHGRSLQSNPWHSSYLDELLEGDCLRFHDKTRK